METGIKNSETAHAYDVAAVFGDSNGGALNQYSLRIAFDYQLYSIAWAEKCNGTSTTIYDYIRYDCPYYQTFDISFYIHDGMGHVGVNGIETTHQFSNIIPNRNLRAVNVYYYSSDHWNETFSLYSKKLEFGKGGCTFHDGLHKTITPWGYDLTYSLQIHADDCNAALLGLLANVTETYGIVGEIEVWAYTDPAFNGQIQMNVSDPEYKAGIDKLDHSDGMWELIQ
jgi:hypothetical protein